jgi:gliding motility-associated-like protein
MRVSNFNVFCSISLHKLQTLVLLSLFLLSFTAFTQSSKDPEFSATEKLVIGYLPEEYKSHPDYLKNQLDGIPANIELIQYRTASQKTFVDITGNYHTQKTGGYFHYFKNGLCLDIQDELSESSNQKIGIINSELPILVDKQTGETSLYLEKNKSNTYSFGKDVSLLFQNNSKETIQSMSHSEQSSSEYETNFLTFKNVFSGINREQTINYYSVRTNYSIQSPIAFSENTKFIVLKDKIKLSSTNKISYFEGEMSENGWYGTLKITNENGDIVATISPAQIFDSFQSNSKEENSKHIVPGFYKIITSDTGTDLCIAFDADYLRKQDLVYPVIIDPTVSNTYANHQAVQDKNTQFNANCQATMAVTFPISSFSVSGSNLTWRMWAKGYIYANSSTTYYADKVEQRSRVGANGNWTATQSGTGTNFQGSSYNYTSANNGITYTLNNSTIANGCYNNQNTINYFWQGYQTYFPVNANSSTNVAGCVFNYQELVTNTWMVTTTYSAGATINAVNSQTVCAGQQTSAISFSGTGSSYNWTNNNTAIGLGASGTGTIGAFTGTNNTSSPISSTITVTPMLNGCPGTPTTFTITVNPTPTVTNPGNQTICTGQSTSTVTFAGSAGATFNWTNNNTATGLSANGIGDIPSFIGTNTTNAAITSSIIVSPVIGTCTGTSQTFTITVSPTPVVNTISPQSICAGQQTSAITIGGTATTYNWVNDNTSIGLGANGSGNIAAFTGTNSGTSAITGTITVTPVSGSCIGATSTFTITINPSPSVTNPGNQTLCVGQSTTIVTFSGTSGATFNWTNDNTATGLAANGISDIPAFTTTNTTSSAITSTITVTPSLGTCNGSPITFTITVNPLPTVTAVSAQTICVGTQTTAITFGGTGTTFNWTNDNTAIGLGANGTGNIVAFTGTNTTSSAITGTITVTPSTSLCTGNPSTFAITVTPLTTPTFTQLGPYCQNATPGALATSSTNSPAISGIWSPATVSTTTVGTQVYTFTPSTGQCASPTTMSIDVTQLLTPTFTQLGPYCQNAAAVTLPTSSTNTPAISGTWNPATITTATAGNATYTFTPAANQCAGTTTMSVLINVQPTVTISSQTICAGQSASLVATANPTGGTYLWSNNQTTSTITVTPNATTTYSVLYIVNTCNASASTTVTVNPIINPNFNALGPYCQNSTPGVFTTTSTNGISGTWNPSVISTTTPGNQIYTFTPAAGVCASTATMTVVTTPLITPTFSAIGPLCQNTTAPFLPLSSTNTPAINGTWSPSTVSTTTLGTSTYTFTPTAGQCASIAALNITVGVSPSPDINTNFTQGCAPLSVTLSSVSLPNATYSWTSNGVNIGNGSTLNTVFNSAGCFDIALHVNINGCTSDTIVSDYICVENVPNAAFTVNPTYFTETNQEVNFTNNSLNAVNYVWYFGDGDSSTIFEPDHFYSNIVGNMQATLTATSSFGCSDTYSVIIPFRDDIVYYIPNTFTPDGDQNNQAWGPVFTKGFDPHNFNLQVFDRWGEMVWESNDARAKWDGTYGSNGVKVQQGTYIYKIKFQPKETDKKYTITGHINLLK